MRVSTTIVGLVGALAGTATAVAGYQHVAAIDPVGRPSTTALPVVGRPLPAAPPRIRVKMADCKRPATLVRGACVTTVTRTQVVYDPAPVQPASAPAVAPVQAAAAPARPARPAATRHRVSPPREHESDDHGDDRKGSEAGDD